MEINNLRQPLQTLRLLRGIFAQKVTDPEILKLVNRTEETLDVIAGMLDLILDINQLEAGVVRPQIISFPVNDLLDRLRDEFSVHARAASLGWCVVPCRKIIISDPHLLEEMIRNLLSNAIKYTTGGKILLGCRARAGHLSIEVWDTGPGIPETELKPIFDEFHRTASSVSSGPGRGFGLGLSIVQRLGNLLGHTIDVRSRVGRGSVFTIDVPIGHEISGEWRKQQETLAAGRAPSPLGTVLIVEDDPSVREILGVFLTSLGHRTAGVATAADALQLVAKGAAQPDIVIADYTLPGGRNGLDLITDLRAALHADIPAIMLTGDISTATLCAISQRGYPHLNKPVRPEQLSALIAQLLAQHPPAVALQHRHQGPSSKSGHVTTIFVVDDDTNVRETVRDLLELKGYRVNVFPSGHAFLNAFRSDLIGCLILDARMPGIGGIDVLKQLRARASKLPVIMITGQGDIATAVEAMKAGAVDFIEKPIGDGELLTIIERALDHVPGSPEYSEWRAEAARRMTGLTKRQREILGLVAAGHPNKEIAWRLGVQQRTVESHRAIVMKKMGAKSLADLVRLSLAAT